MAVIYDTTFNANTIITSYDLVSKLLNQNLIETFEIPKKSPKLQNSGKGKLSKFIKSLKTFKI